PHNFDTIVITIGNTLDTILLNVKSGKSDYAQSGLNPTAYAQLAQQYGVNKSQFFVYAQLGTSYLAMNHDRPLFNSCPGSFHGSWMTKPAGACYNVNLAKAVNYATDRHALVLQAGAFAGHRNDQILPPGMQGAVNKTIYPNLPNFTKAKALAAGHVSSSNA